MISFTKEQKIHAFTLLSEPEKEVAFSESVGNKINSVSFKYGFDEAKAQEFKFTVGLYLLKLVSGPELLQALREHFPDQPVDSMLTDIKSIVFPEIEKVKNEYKPAPEKDGSDTEDINEPQQSNAVPAIKMRPSDNSEANVTRDDIMKAIEDPLGQQESLKIMNTAMEKEKAASAVTPSTGNAIEDKLKGIVFTLKENKNIVIDSTPKPAPIKTPSTAIPADPQYTKGTDPYREPME